VTSATAFSSASGLPSTWRTASVQFARMSRAKAWSDGWLQKLKDDLRLVKGDLAVIVSEALPKDITHFAQMKGIWVTSRDCALNLAAALRSQLLEISTVKAAAFGKNEKMEILYRYLSGPEFKQRIEAIVEAFIGMQDGDHQPRRQPRRLEPET
jgi:hypothetical protein